MSKVDYFKKVQALISQISSGSSFDASIIPSTQDIRIMFFGVTIDVSPHFADFINAKKSEIKGAFIKYLEAELIYAAEQAKEEAEAVLAALNSEKKNEEA
jgi:hypothetical protein